ncbi:RDD family protein [Sulfurimonas sp.]|uniref:RDD family protein n=1 Tax=Sulfurimonas sp. TaxID=2022749 RepID=UPI00263404CD|nr:RDD family protein [Sulfurimonas sp.]MDD5157543.1 RDD family protein [Sulfurimonas sp.]
MKFRELKKKSKTKKETVLPKYIYAPYSFRVKSFIVDLFMIYAPILYTITYVIMNGKDDFQSSQLAPLAGVTTYAFVYALLLSRFGQTPGKKAYDMKVVDDKSGKNISFARALFRFVAFLFTATTLLGLIVPFYRKDKKALHDLVCRTIVVVEKK